MGKNKNKNKNKKRQHAKKKKNRFIKRQFLEIYCPNCELCLINPPNPTFCYEELYKTDQAKFFKECFGALIAFGRRLKESNGSAKDITLAQFNELICDTFCDDSKCGLTKTCFRSFKNQISGKKEKGKKNKVKGKQKQYICQPYPSVFTNECKEWKDKIERILNNGNNNREQDKVEESTKQSEGYINRQAEVS